MMIFEDPTRKRWRVVVSVAAVVLIAITGLVALFVSALSRDAALPTLADGWERVEAATTLAWDEESVPKEPLRNPVVTRERHAPVYPQPLNARGPLLTAFLVQDDPHSLRRLCEIGGALDVIFPDCFTFDTPDGAIRETVNKRALDLQRSTGAALMPRISNTTAAGVWSVDAVNGLLAQPDAQARWVENLVDRLVALNSTGVNIDIESLEAGDSSLFLDFLSLAAESLHRHGMYLTVDVPLNEEQYDYEAIGKIADAVIVMAYDEHYSTGKPGPIAGLEWFGDGVREYAKRLPPEKLIVALGAYGYDWPEHGAAEVLSFEQAIGLAQKHRASIQTTSDSVNSGFAYVDARGVRHSVSFLDAVSAWNQVALISSAADLEVDPKKLLGVSVWRLGLEDAGVWPLLARGRPMGCRDLRRCGRSQHLVRQSCRAKVSYSG